ncbi:hypothetical protein [Sphingomonas sp. LY160]|uniref:hypothetical protein n=1 Tax=Sphingomonas sp. LY160 TaxID=3095342 RepID=UPI002ADEBAAB|nr:hypothetical protein [Sphingomonas sp. LY160]MEA1071218.1 hypothetical protein [Sphingomonas sp. LY160]
MKDLLDVSGLKRDGPSTLLVQFLRKFADEVFGNGGAVADADWPWLEDVFTTIDLAANTGHHLGRSYSAADLRTVRRCFLIRMIRMLEIRYRREAKSAGPRWEALQTLYRTVNFETSVFLSMNWDTVVEDALWRERGVRRFDYRCGAKPVVIDDLGTVQLNTRPKGSSTAYVLKPHGSINWMYFDSCRQVFWFQPRYSERIADRLFKSTDADRIERLTGNRPKIRTLQGFCPSCQVNALSTRFATFSFKKALDFPMYGSTWREAENKLRSAQNWIFFGYSMPSADYEFKYMLKSSYLGRSDRPRIILITGGEDATSTVQNYRRYFGRDSIKNEDIFTDGLEVNGLSRLKTTGILQ